MKNQIEWVKKGLRLCTNPIQFEEEEKKKQFKKLEEEYNCFSAGERQNIRKIIKEQFQTSDQIYIYSCFVHYMEVDDFLEDICAAAERETFDVYTGIMMEFQIRTRIDAPYKQVRKIHKKNLVNLREALGRKYPYIPVESRNPKRIVLMAEQLLSIRHAPTRVLLMLIYVLQKYLGYEVLLFLCPSDWSSCLEGVWYMPGGARSSDEITEGMQQMIYRDTAFPGCQFHMYSPDCMKNYQEVIAAIYEWKPLFVLNVGTFHAITDIPADFVTTASMTMTTECPVSEAQILLRLGKLDASKERKYEQELCTGQRQLFMEGRMPPVIEKGQRKYKCSELGLPENVFLIAVVGNRLDAEVDEKFAEVVQQILKREPQAVFVFIGEMNKSKVYFEDGMFQKRVHYLGYREDLADVYSVIDLYLNPKRIGGGYSGAMAVSEGVPVITLPDCDVAYDVGKDCVVQDYQKMIELACTYMEEDDVYKVAVSKLEQYHEESIEKQMTDYVEKMVKSIRERIDGESNYSHR